MRQVLCGLLLFAPLSLVSTPVSAQPDVNVWWNASNKSDTLMDFGVTLEGVPVTVTFTVVNNENFTVSIFETIPQTDPFYLIVNVPEVDPSDPAKEEFVRAVELPYFIPAKTSRSFGVTYRALANNPDFPVDSVAEALLIVRVVDSTAPTSASTDKTFRLRALKTNRILASNTPLITFDSVYIQPAPFPPEKTYTVTNLVTVRIPVQRQLLEMQTSVVGQPEIIADTLPQPLDFGSKGKLQWQIHYAPHDKGRDSAHFLVVYKANAGPIPDTIVARISGIGVEQKLRVIRAPSDKGAVVVRGDTIDFGDVDADGTGGVVARVEIRNEGNVNVYMLSETESGPLRDTMAYVVERSLRSDSPSIETNLVDTLVVRFDPLAGGTHTMRYDIGTDLRSRPITGVPDGAQSKRLTFTGFARSPQMQITPPSLDFGSVVLLPTCESASERTFTIRNNGNVDLRVDSIVVQPKSAMLFPDKSNFIVGVAQQQQVKVRYIPTQIETLNAQIVLYTNAFGVPYAMQTTGRSVPRDSILVSMPLTLSARPGTPVFATVTVDADRIALAETAHLEVSFDASLLRYRASATSGTASEGAAITEIESPRGLLTIDLDANGSFTSNPTLLEIIFDTYLGDKAETELGLSSGTTRFGNTGCESILDVRTVSGLFMIDSVCGLDYKTAVTTRSILSSDVVPNPVNDNAKLLITTPKATHVTYRIVDAFGQQLSETTTVEANAGLNIYNLFTYNLHTYNLHPYNLHPYSLPPGLYFVEIISAPFRHVKTFVVDR